MRRCSKCQESIPAGDPVPDGAGGEVCWTCMDRLVGHTAEFERIYAQLKLLLS